MKIFTPYILLMAFIVSLHLAKAQSYTIPVVFHVLHQGGPENIADSQIIDAVRILNDDYNKHNADTANVIPYYQNNMADVQVTFRLASIDPNGQLTNGIDRIYSSLTHVGNDTAKLNQWNPARYLNIWVVAQIQSGIGGFAYYPWAVISTPQLDGVMVLSHYVGSIGTSNNGLSRALTHEIGHYLCLLHPSGWGDTNCAETDSVADTHASKGQLTCSDTVPSGQCIAGVPTNYQTFMDGSYCSCMFTHGQKDRIHYCLNTYRDSLTMPSNLIATGTTDVRTLPNKGQALSVVPNPFNSIIRIKGLQEGNYTIAVFDITGREVKGFANLYATDNYLNLDVSSVTTKGIYVLKVTGANGHSNSLKLVRE